MKERDHFRAAPRRPGREPLLDENEDLDEEPSELTMRLRRATVDERALQRLLSGSLQPWERAAARLVLLRELGLTRGHRLIERFLAAGAPDEKPLLERVRRDPDIPAHLAEVAARDEKSLAILIARVNDATRLHHLLIAVNDDAPRLISLIAMCANDAARLERLMVATCGESWRLDWYAAGRVARIRERLDISALERLLARAGSVDEAAFIVERTLERLPIHRRGYWELMQFVISDRLVRDQVHYGTGDPARTPDGEPEHAPELPTLHDAAMLDDPDYEIVAMQQNPDETLSATWRTRLAPASIDGKHPERWSEPISTVLAPRSWTIDEIITAGRFASQAARVMGPRLGDNATLHRAKTDGVEFEAVLDRFGRTLSVYPTGGQSLRDENQWLAQGDFGRITGGEDAGIDGAVREAGANSQSRGAADSRRGRGRS